jgi:hypothetical protein
MLAFSDEVKHSRICLAAAKSVVNKICAAYLDKETHITAADTKRMTVVIQGTLMDVYTGVVRGWAERRT